MYISNYLVLLMKSLKKYFVVRMKPDITLHKAIQSYSRYSKRAEFQQGERTAV